MLPAKEAVRHLELLEALFEDASEEDTAQRVLSGLRAHGSVLQTRKMEGGLMCVALMVHRIELQKNTAQDVVEKVYLPIHKSRVEREAYLYSTFSAARLKSPAFLGWTESGGFCSVFYEFVKGFKPTIERWNEGLRRDLLGRLWENTQSVVSDPSALEPEARLDVSACISCLEQMGSSICLEVASWLRIKTDRLTGRLAALPLFVMHGDFYPGNVLVGDHDVYLIDWDKWNMQRLGSGARAEWLAGGEEEDIYEFYTGDANPMLDSAAFDVSAFFSSCRYFSSKNKRDVIERLCINFLARRVGLGDI